MVMTSIYISTNIVINKLDSKMQAHMHKTKKLRNKKKMKVIDHLFLYHL